MRATFRTWILGVAAATLLAPAAGLAANVVIVNGDGPGEGFNDPTFAAPVGGNAGTTVGQQRLIAFQRAADIWGAKLDSAVTVEILARFDPLSCTATSAVLGSAGTLTASRDFLRAPLGGTWYHAALANKIAGEDLEPGTPDLRARFNSNIGTPGCLETSGWYYGLDASEPTGRIDLVAVLLHEFAHGLGFAAFTSVSTGQKLLGHDDVYSRYYYDYLLGQVRNDMTNPERVFSAVNTGSVVWNGEQVTAGVPAALGARPSFMVKEPAGLADSYPVGTAAFGPALTEAGVSGQVALGLPANPSSSSTLGCGPMTSAVAGKIALVDRGSCTFVTKAANAQAAGAVALVVANNTAGLIGLGGSGPITIPAVMITQDLGARVKAALPGVVAKVGLDPTLRAGARDGYALLYAPNPVQPGSSISHFDVSAFPNQLMEPAINADLTHSVDVVFPAGQRADLTRPLLWDVGWYPDADLDGAPDAVDACPGTDGAATVWVNGIDTGVRDRADGAGCPFSQRLAGSCGGIANPGEWSSCVTRLTNAFVKNRWMYANEQAAIDSAAARTN
ncbi:MAG TPA: PA domain-containing protein [Anaeromyxobacteraceae bacterium]|nr:PA domain-containing protein [Anaeromyxobacteraceae bacterium]